jgi:molybdopterin molybdotransferase
MITGINPDKGRKLLLAQSAAMRTETVPLATALGRVLARDFVARADNPPFDRSAFDGYALRSADVQNAAAEHPITLIIDEEIPAGHSPKFGAKPGHAAKILTGAPIPKGADAVIKFELTDFTDESVTIREPLARGANVICAGEDFPKGAALLEGGGIITPAFLGVIASQGICEIEVFERPIATLINVGSEIVEPGVPLPDAKIYNSNKFSLGGYIRELGLDINFGEIIPDDPERIAKAVQAAACGSDIVITTGGASTGDYDFAAKVAELTGGEALFHKVAMRPGGAILAYVLDGTVVLSLSGSPGAAALGLMHIANPYLRKLCGRADVWPEECIVRLKESQPRTNPITRLLRGSLAIEDGEALFIAERSQRGGDLASLIKCDLLIEIPAGTPPLDAGAKVRAFRI